MPAPSAECSPTGSAHGRVVAIQPKPEMPAGTTFILMAGFLGLGAGAVFAWAASLAPVERVGSVTGIVGAAGGLGGFFPPLVMGAMYNSQDHSYMVGLTLLCIVALIAFAYTLFGIVRRPRPRRSECPR